MKNKQLFTGWSVSFFLLTIVLALFSWIGSIYGLGAVQSLLSTEGIRWILGHVIENYVYTPALGVVLLLFMGLGIGVHAGLGDALKRLFQRKKLLSRKERRSVILASITILIYIGVFALLMVLPWNFLQSITGSWLYSPFSKGFIYIFSVGVGCSGLVYGYASETFRKVSDVVEGMSCLIGRYASYFVGLFFVVQFFYSFEYTGFVNWMGIPTDVFNVLFQFCCYLPLITEIFRLRKLL